MGLGGASRRVQGSPPYWIAQKASQLVRMVWTPSLLQCASLPSRQDLQKTRIGASTCTTREARPADHHQLSPRMLVVLFAKVAAMTLSLGDTAAAG